MQHITSSDGVRIAYTEHGTGTPVILVGGALNDHRARAAGLPLAQHMTMRAICYDRRGRGQSDNAPPDPRREIDDLVALLEHTGASRVYGMSSGAILALEAAAAGAPITALALYEPPYAPPRISPTYGAELAAHVAAGRNGDAVALFMTDVVGMPRPAVSGMRAAPFWPQLATLGPSLLHDHALTTNAPPAHVAIPVACICGSDSPAWMQHAVRTLAERLPRATHHVLAGQTHDVDPARLGPLLAQLLS